MLCQCNHDKLSDFKGKPDGLKAIDTTGSAMLPEFGKIRLGRKVLADSPTSFTTMIDITNDNDRHSAATTKT